MAVLLSNLRETLVRTVREIEAGRADLLKSGGDVPTPTASPEIVFNIEIVDDSHGFIELSETLNEQPEMVTTQSQEASEQETIQLPVTSEETQEHEATEDTMTQNYGRSTVTEVTETN